MFGFFKKKTTPNSNVIAKAVEGLAHKQGVLVCGDPGNGSTLLSQVIAKEITKNKVKTKFFISCYDANDFKYLVDSKKLNIFVIKEENLDFNFQILTPNALNKEKLMAFTALIIKTMGIQKKEEALAAVINNIEYFNYFDTDLLYKSLENLEGFSDFTWNYLTRKNVNGFNVFDGLSEKLSQYDAVFVETDSFNTNPIAYDLVNFVRLLHNSVVFILDTTQAIEEDLLKLAYSQEAVIVHKHHPAIHEMNWFNMWGITKSHVNTFDFMSSEELRSYTLGSGALYLKDKHACTSFKWKLGP